jgi:DNA-binding transcriptional ArsR family regulator
MSHNGFVRLGKPRERRSRRTLRRAAAGISLSGHMALPESKSTHRRNSSSQPAPNGEDALYERQVRICKALANPTRLRILDLVAKRAYTVSGLQKELNIPLANVSIQLSILRAAGVVSTEKKGKEVHCFLALPEVRQACHFIRQVLKAQVRDAQKLPI